MVRLISLLMMLALALTNSSAVAAAACQHIDAQAHADARQSSDSGVAAAARGEEAAAAAAVEKGTLADAGAVQLAGFLVPSAPSMRIPLVLEPTRGDAYRLKRLASRTISPLLEPPLA